MKNEYILNNVLVSRYTHLYASDSVIKENSLVLYTNKSSAILLRCMRHNEPQKRNSTVIKEKKKIILTEYTSIKDIYI